MTLFLIEVQTATGATPQRMFNTLHENGIVVKTVSAINESTTSYDKNKR